MTTSKKILYFSWALFGILIYFKIRGYDVGDAITVIGGMAASIVTGFYMWKSKCENREKIAFAAVEKLADKYGIEPTIELISEILKD